MVSFSIDETSVRSGDGDLSENAAVEVEESVDSPANAASNDATTDTGLFLLSAYSVMLL